jgi:hypothetical protein
MVPGKSAFVFRQKKRHLPLLLARGRCIAGSVFARRIAEFADPRPGFRPERLSSWAAA